MILSPENRGSNAPSRAPTFFIRELSLRHAATSDTTTAPRRPLTPPSTPHGPVFGTRSRDGFLQPLPCLSGTAQSHSTGPPDSSIDNTQVPSALSDSTLAARPPCFDAQETHQEAKDAQDVPLLRPVQGEAVFSLRRYSASPSPPSYPSVSTFSASPR